MIEAQYIMSWISYYYTNGDPIDAGAIDSNILADGNQNIIELLSRSISPNWDEYPGDWWGIEYEMASGTCADFPWGQQLSGVTEWMDDDNTTPIDDAMQGVKRLREGIERFLITDINNPAGSASAQSEIIVMYDAWATGNDGTGGSMSSAFNHMPGGCNVLYMDGHVSFVKLNAEAPMLCAKPTSNRAPTSYAAPVINAYYVGGWG